MTTLETAIKYGVPMPETCEELEFKSETLFGWRPNKITCEWEITLGSKFAIPAPQMHEIAPLLPEDIHIQHNLAYPNFDVFELELTKNGLFYDSENVTVISEKGKSLDSFYARFENNHYAEAYAQLYIKLKKEGVI